MCNVPISKTNNKTTNLANVITKIHSTSDFIKFVYAVAFSPTIDTWIQVVKARFYNTSPVLTLQDINKFLTNSIHLTMEYYNQPNKKTLNKYP